MLGLKERLRELRRLWRLWRVVVALRRLPQGTAPPRALLERLRAAWENEGYAAKIDFLMAVSQAAVATPGPILECGTGVTTLLLGVLAGRRGVETWSLEHERRWSDEVTATLRRLGVRGVRVVFAPLRTWDDFDWYDSPPDRLPQEVRLVVCDGPPGTTRGGRYGLLPVAAGRLAAGVVIVLDDARREGEQSVLARWEHEFGCRVRLESGAEGTLAEVTRGAR